MNITVICLWWECLKWWWACLNKIPSWPWEWNPITRWTQCRCNKCNKWTRCLQWWAPQAWACLSWWTKTKIINLCDRNSTWIPWANPGSRINKEWLLEWGKSIRKVLKTSPTWKKWITSQNKLTMSKLIAKLQNKRKKNQKKYKNWTSRAIIKILLLRTPTKLRVKKMTTSLLWIEFNCWS